MRYVELLTEMAFDHKRVIRALESFDVRIFEHAVKIIVNDPVVVEEGKKLGAT
jgi:hypothetical protein